MAEKFLRMTQMKQNLKFYPVGIFEDITAVFLDLATKTPQNQTNDKKVRFLSNQSKFLFKSTTIFWNRNSIYLNVETKRYSKHNLGKKVR